MEIVTFENFYKALIFKLNSYELHIKAAKKLLEQTLFLAQ